MLKGFYSFWLLLSCFCQFWRWAGISLDENRSVKTAKKPQRYNINVCFLKSNCTSNLWGLWRKRHNVFFIGIINTVIFLSLNSQLEVFRSWPPYLLPSGALYNIPQNPLEYDWLLSLLLFLTDQSKRRWWCIFSSKHIFLWNCAL